MSPATYFPVPEASTFAPAPFHLRMATMLSALLTLDIALTQAVGLAGFAHQIVGFLPGLLALCGAYAYARWAGHARFAEAAALGAWAVLLSNLLSVLIQSAGRSSVPLADSFLAGADQAMGFSTAAVVAWVGHFPVLRLGFAIAYASMPVLVLAALFLPVAMGRARDSQRFVMAVFAAAILTAALFSFLPAAGPWVSGAYAPSHMQASVESYLGQLKTGGELAINPDAAGVVSFPSFHLVLAILPVFALWRIPIVRWFALALACAIAVSTITTGWHYGIDVLGGVAVAFAAQRIAEKA
jgi:membrane-associated phospholipid phosphatase